MTDFIYQAKNCLPEQLCNQIIQLFEMDKNKFKGETNEGITTNIKDTTDLIISHCSQQNEIWFNIENFLCEQLGVHIKEYVKYINKDYYKAENNSGVDRSLFTDTNFYFGNFLIQKYEKGKGKYLYHHDFKIDYKEENYRAIAYIFYLNTIEEGGETEFWGNYRVKPECGKLLFFPSVWCYPHRGIMPISSDKYIITGWLLIKDFK